MATTRRIRRKKHAAGQTVIPERKAKEIQKLAEDTEDLGLQILETQSQIDKNLAVLKEYMEGYDVKDVTAVYGSYLYDTPKGRSSTTISVPEFRDKVTDEEFDECVSISVTKAKGVLTAKELADVSDVVPAKPGTPRVVYKPKKK